MSPTLSIARRDIGPGPGYRSRPYATAAERPLASVETLRQMR